MLTRMLTLNREHGDHTAFTSKSSLIPLKSEIQFEIDMSPEGQISAYPLGDILYELIDHS